MALEPIQRVMLSRILDGTDNITGWTAPINKVVWPIVKDLPPELVEIEHDIKRARLTEIGKALLKYL